jgi:hypothetical protein
MKLSKKRVGLYGSVITAVLVVSLIVVFMQNSGLVPMSKIAFAAGTPDAQGNQIFQIMFYQNATGVFSNVAYLTFASYTPGYTLTIPSNQHTIIYCQTYLNVSLASSSAIAQTRARVYLTITGVVTGATMTVFGAINIGSYWVVAFAYPSATTPPASTWIPATDVTYNMTFQYQAYY